MQLPLRPRCKELGKARSGLSGQVGHAQGQNAVLSTCAPFYQCLSPQHCSIHCHALAEHRPCVIHGWPIAPVGLAVLGCKASGSSMMQEYT